MYIEEWNRILPFAQSGPKLIFIVYFIKEKHEFPRESIIGILNLRTNRRQEVRAYVSCRAFSSSFQVRISGGNLYFSRTVDRHILLHSDLIPRAEILTFLEVTCLHLIVPTVIYSLRPEIRSSCEGWYTLVRIPNSCIKFGQ